MVKTYQKCLKNNDPLNLKKFGFLRVSWNYNIHACTKQSILETRVPFTSFPTDLEGPKHKKLEMSSLLNFFFTNNMVSNIKKQCWKKELLRQRKN